MDTKEEASPATTDATGSPAAPFVNEECGDTMWDNVLKEAEERLNQSITRKPDQNSSEPLRQKRD